MAFVRLRDRCDFKTACKQLGAWSDEKLTEEERHFLNQKKEDREQAARAKEAERTRRIELRDEIYMMVGIEAEVSGRLSELLQGAAPAYEDEVEHCWGALSLAFADRRDCEIQYMAMIGMAA